MDQDFKRPARPIDVQHAESGETIDSGPDTADQSKPEVIQPKHQHHKTGKIRRFLTWLLLLLVLLGLAAGAWLYHRDQIAARDVRIESLQAEVKSLSDKLAQDLKAADKGTETEAVTAANRDAIAQAVSDKAYGDLTSFFGDSVTIILAASEGLGVRTPTQAVEDLTYLNNATAPWNFELDDETTEAYGSGDYAAYFPADALVGKSANNYVVSFSFTSTGKISTIFIAPDAELL